MSKYFLIVTVDPELNLQSAERERTKKGRALELATSRLNKKFWPLYVRTRCKDKISPGDRLAFYLGGTKELSKQIFASASVEEIEESNIHSDFDDDSKFCTDLPAKIVRLKEISYLEQPVSFKKILPSLSFCPKNPKFWGVVLQGGVKELMASDWEAIFA